MSIAPILNFMPFGEPESLRRARACPTKGHPPPQSSCRGERKSGTRNAFVALGKPLSWYFESLHFMISPAIRAGTIMPKKGNI